MPTQNSSNFSTAATGQVLASAGANVAPAFSSTPSVTSITISDAPTVGTDGANKQYVDTLAAGFTFKTACFAATTANLSATYDNGASGVGATLTNNAAQAAFAVDGTSPSVNARILVKNQTSTFENGIYTLTTVGSGATDWVLTRATDYDATSEIVPGSFVIVENGTVNATTAWIETATVTTIGTDPILFSPFGVPSSGVSSLSDTAGTHVSPLNGNIQLEGVAGAGVGILSGVNTLDFSLLSPFEGDFSFTQSAASSNSVRKVSVINDDVDNAGSHAQFIAQTGGTDSGDPMSIWTVDGGTSWGAGLDRSASSAWVLARSTSLGTNNALSVSTSNALTLNSAFTFPTTDGTSGQVLTTNGAGTVSWQTNTNSTIGFSAYLNTTVSNATGDGTPYTIICDVTQFNIGSGYNTTTGEFTAPVSGRYYFESTIHLVNIESGHTDGSGYFGLPGGMFDDVWTLNVSAVAQGGNDVAFSGGLFFELTVGQVVTVVVNVSSGNKVVGIEGLNAGTTFRTTFSGFLVA